VSFLRAEMGADVLSLSRVSPYLVEAEDEA